MRIYFTQLLIVLLFNLGMAQEFIREELPTSLNTPWEIVYGPDHFLWISEFGGKISRVDPQSGDKTSVYTASDYFNGSALEQNTLCVNTNIGAGTLGMALHPDFMNAVHAYIYLVYSYNSGTAMAPATKFKISRLKWNAGSGTVSADTTLVSNLPSGYDHLGGRLMIITQHAVPYLFLSIGDHGLSETNSPACYNPQSTNPNNLAQDPLFKNGKVHRYHIDGSIPADNPLPGNSFYTRGHRNPQGLMYNSAQNIIYDSEHGDRTDDEINILEAGMNYGWKFVRGFHSDSNYAGESSFVTTYTPYPGIVNDALKEPLFAWCSTAQPSVSAYLDWCTVAPSDGIYYNSEGIPAWKNSLLVVTLKNGSVTDQEMYQFKLHADGKSLIPSTATEPNPKQYFAGDQPLNGRLRDITMSPDGTKIYLINNGGSARDKITVYTYRDTSKVVLQGSSDFTVNLFPNPAGDQLQIQCSEKAESLELLDLLGRVQRSYDAALHLINLEGLAAGTYFIRLKTSTGRIDIRKVIKLN